MRRLAATSGRWWLVMLAVLSSVACGTVEQRNAGSEVIEMPRQLKARQVIVTLAPDTPARWAALGAAIAADHGLIQVGAFPLTSLGVQCLVLETPPAQSVDETVARLSADPRVESAQLNQVFEGLLPGYDDPYASLQHGALEIRANLAQRWSTGKGVRIAVVDTGVDIEHRDLRGQVAGTANFVEKGEASFAEDRHGTAMAGVIAASANNKIGIFGIAPEAQVVAVKACWHPRASSMEARCSSWTLAKAIDFGLGDHIQVVNLSLAGPRDALLGRLIERALSSGITVVAAIMTEGAGPSFPASYPGVIGVLGSDSRGIARVPESLMGGPWLVAPGTDILTTTPHDGYDFLSGSSLAAAHVSGVAALLLALDPSLKPAAIKARLLEFARPVDQPPRPGLGSLRAVDACMAVASLVPAADCR
jgi:subtilisin family serine protease